MADKVERYFEWSAERWDSIYDNQSPFMRKLDRALRKAVYTRFNVAMNEAGDVRGKTILDVGCGSGRYMIEYAKAGAKMVVGIDFSEPMLDIARDLATREGVSDACELRSGDFTSVDFGERFDVVQAMGVFDYVGDAAGFLRRMCEVSRDRVIASFPGRNLIRMHIRRLRYSLRGCPVFYYSEEEIREIARQAGLNDYQLIFMPESGTGFVLSGRVTETSVAGAGARR